MISNRCARKSLVTNCNSIISKNYLRFLVDSNDIVYKRNGNFCNDILRLDLFRDIKNDSKKSITDFIGGLFHALKHFSLAE